MILTDRKIEKLYFYCDQSYQMRNTKKVSVWPVGLVGGLKYEGPKCSKDKVTGWYSYWATDRMFRIDFAGLLPHILV